MNRVVLVHAKGGFKILEKITKPLEDKSLEYIVVSKDNANKYILDNDLVLVVGSDRDFLEVVQATSSKNAVYSLLAPPGYTSFFSTATLDEVDLFLTRVSRGGLVVENISRIRVLIDNSREYYALNEVAIFSDKSGVLVSYALELNDEILWRDSGDGLIISTPTGSTGYALSAGGPVVVKNAPVILVVPVNSINPFRKPLVAPDTSRIVVRDVSSRSPCVAIIDGVVRERIRNTVEVSKAPKPLSVLKIETRVSESIVKKKIIALEIEDLAPSAKYVYKMLEIYGEMTLKELVEVTNLPERTVRHALKQLQERGLVEKITSLRDARVNIYRLKKK